MHARRLCAVSAALALAVAACSKVQGGTTTGASNDDSECTPKKVGLANASVQFAPIWKLPSGCSVQGSGKGTTTLVSEAAFAALIDCKGQPSGIDWTTQSLVIVRGILSPATVGHEVFDDEHTVTIVTKFRESCPSEYPPMPVPYTLGFLLPAGGAARTFVDASCKVKRSCS